MTEYKPPLTADQLTEARKEYERAWAENPHIAEFLYQNDIEKDSDEYSMAFVAGWYMWSMAKGIKE